MLSDTINNPTSSRENVAVLLDGSPVRLPNGRISLGSIRSYLESLALESDRVLGSFTVDGSPAHETRSNLGPLPFALVEAKSFALADIPLRLAGLALEQTARAEAALQSAIAVVLAAEGDVAREFWWDLVKLLKLPLLTMALLPESACGQAAEGASVAQLRKWQFQQLGCIIRDVDEACWSQDPHRLAQALESRATPWLANLRASLDLMHEALILGRAA
jgi:hypothetical protein